MIRAGHALDFAEEALCAAAVSDSCAVPLPETGSLIEPDQLPAGDAGEGDVGVEPPPQPARPTITTMTGASRRVMRWRRYMLARVGRTREKPRTNGDSDIKANLPGPAIGADACRILLQLKVTG